MNPARPVRPSPLPHQPVGNVPAEPRRGLKTWLRRIALTGFALVLVTSVGGVATYLYFDRGLPSVERLRSYRPPQVSKVACEDGSACAEYYRERRTLMDAKLLPDHVRNAFLAAEDADFYHHEGLDYFGMFRAGLKALLPGGHLTGASTITQQTCRNLLLTQERHLARKIREWILTPRLEKALSKDQILNLYLNQIYFGQGRYGVEEAALYYFGKSAKNLSVGESATLAGTVQSPERINPVTNIVRSKKRQQYVLHQLVKHGFMRPELLDAELEKPILLAPRPAPSVGPYYIEEIRRTLVSRYGDEALLAGGLRVQVAMNPRLQAMADEALRNGLETLDHKMGYGGPLGHISPADFQRLEPKLQARLAESGRRPRDEQLVADLAHLAAPAPEPAAVGDEAEEPDRTDTGEPLTPALSAEDRRIAHVALVPVKEGLRLGGFVSSVDDRKKEATVDIVGRKARITYGSLAWARPRGVGKWTAPPTKVSDVLHLGDVVRIKILKLAPAPALLEATLDQVPAVQGAITVIDPVTRHVVAMAGGYDFELSSFNRATQAKRQPGSSFKPFLYAAALASEKYTPLTLVNDAPESIRDPYTGKSWRPQNYEKNGFDGPMTLRQALTHSKNTVSVRLIEALTPQVAIDFAQKAGIHSPLPKNLTLALGTGEVTQLEITNAYATLSSLGKYADPILLMRVADAQGTVLEEHHAAFTETLPPAVAYLTTSLMKSVVEEGTATPVRELNRPAAGKTGTANEFRDAWFNGYTPDYVTSVWVGFDDHSTLGKGQTGAMAALPIWMAFMKPAEEGLPSRDFEAPVGIQFARVDPLSGLLAGGSVPGRLEPFLQGTAPTAEAPPPGTVRQDQYYLQDQGRNGL